VAAYREWIAAAVAAAEAGVFNTEMTLYYPL